jgi:prephenate dehydratase
MTKLESGRLDRSNFLEGVYYYVDIEGHPEDHNVRLAFEEVLFFSKEMKILGVYRAHPFRTTFQKVKSELSYYGPTEEA